MNQEDDFSSGARMVYVSPAQLAANLEALDTDALLAKITSGRMTGEALELARAILRARGIAADIEAPAGRSTGPAGAMDEVSPASPRSRTIVRVAFGLYIAFVLLCSIAVIADPPWSKPANGSWSGMIGTIAALAAGFPWTHVFIRALAAAPSVAHIVLMSLAGVVVNITLFVLYLRRA